MVQQNSSISGVSRTATTETKKTVTPTAAGESTNTASTATTASGTQEMGQQEFLTLLVNQLQHQDPLDPMKSEEFAVQLAQFSSLEQLISINKKLGVESGGNEVASMASYLGNEIVLKDGQVTMLDGKGNNLLMDIPKGTQSLRIDFIDENGDVVARHSLEEVEAGRQAMPLEGLDVPDGKYDVRVVSVDAQGKFVDLTAKPTLTVEGFVLEPEAKLLAGGEEVSPADVVEVYQGKSSR